MRSHSAGDTLRRLVELIEFRSKTLLLLLPDQVPCRVCFRHRCHFHPLPITIISRPSSPPPTSNIWRVLSLRTNGRLKTSRFLMRWASIDLRLRHFTTITTVQRSHPSAPCCCLVSISCALHRSLWLTTNINHHHHHQHPPTLASPEQGAPTTPAL